MRQIILTTERTQLRKFSHADLENLTAILGDSEVMTFSMTGAIGKEQVAELISTWISDYEKNILAPWAIIYQNRLIGYAGIDTRIVEGQTKQQITFRLSRDCWNKGLGTELAQSIKDYALINLKLEELVAIVDPQNKASINILKKIGMVFDKTINYGGLTLDLYKV